MAFSHFEHCCGAWSAPTAFTSHVQLEEAPWHKQKKQTRLIPVNNFGTYIPYYPYLYPLYSHVSLHMLTHIVLLTGASYDKH